MRQIKFFIAFIGTILLMFSCLKNEDKISEYEAVSNQRMYFGGEEDEGTHNHKVKDYDILVNTLGPIFSEYEASSLWKDALSSVVIESGTGGSTYYCFALEEYKNVTYKILTKFDNDNTLVELGVIRIAYNGRFLDDYYHYRADFEDFKGVITSYKFDDFMNQNRSEMEDCMKLVLGNDGTSGGGLVIVGDGDGNGDGDNPTGNDSGGTVFVTITCGCPPAHAGGNANASCRCKKPNEMKITIINTINGENTASTRNDYWECIDILLDCGMITDEEILAKRLKDCDLANEPYDNGEGESDVYPDTEFCEGWLAYRDACLSNNNETNDAWGHYMLHNNGLFDSTIADPSICISTEEMEEIICVKNAIAEFEEINGLELTKTEKKMIEAEATCKDGLADEIECILAKSTYEEALINNIGCNTDEYQEAIDEIIAAGNCDPQSFSEAFNAYFGVTSEPTQQNTLPTLTIGSQLCAGIFDIQDAGDDIHVVGGISGLRFDVVNSANITQTVSFGHLVIQMDKNINDPNCSGSSYENLMAQAVNETIAMVRGLMSTRLNYNAIQSPLTFPELLTSIISQKSIDCVSHGSGGSAEATLTNTPLSWTNACGAFFTQFNTNHISNNNGADCE